MRYLNLSIALAVSTALFTLGCNPSPPAGASSRKIVMGTNMYTLVDADTGHYEFYSGEDIAERLATGIPFGEDERVSYSMLRVPAEYVEQAIADSDGVLSFLMEDTDIDVEFEVRHLLPGDKEGDPPKLRARRFRAGEPWLTGITQIITDKEGNLAFGYDITYWAPLNNGKGVASQYYVGALARDDNMPRSCCVGYPNMWWDKRPEHWR